MNTDNTYDQLNITPDMMAPLVGLSSDSQAANDDDITHSHLLQELDHGHIKGIGFHEDPTHGEHLGIDLHHAVLSELKMEKGLAFISDAELKEAALDFIANGALHPDMEDDNGTIHPHWGQDRDAELNKQLKTLSWFEQEEQRRAKQRSVAHNFHGQDSYELAI